MNALPFTVIANALGELSTKVLDWHVSNCVPGIAVNGAVGGVKFAVYTAVPFTILALEIFPPKSQVPPASGFRPIYSVLALSEAGTSAPVAVWAMPFRYITTVVPL